LKRLQNKCHTETRTQCEQDWKDQQYKDEAKAAGKTQKAHLYYNSVQCSVALSSGFMNVSIVLIFLTLLSLIL
jgi:hypothetical protein